MKSAFLQKGISKEDQKIEATAQTGTTASTTGPSNYTLSDLGNYATQAALSFFPVGRFAQAVKAGRALSKVPSYLSKLNKKFPTGGQMKKHYDDINKKIKQIPPTINKSK